MKKLSLLVLFFYICSFASPQRSQAAVPLAVLAAATVGATVFAIGGTQYALNNSSSSANSYSFTDNAISRSIVMYNKVLMAGAEIMLGKTAMAVFDLKRAFDDGITKAYSSLNLAIENYFDDTQDPLLNEIINFSTYNAYSGYSGTCQSTNYIVTSDSAVTAANCFHTYYLNWISVATNCTYYYYFRYIDDGSSYGCKSYEFYGQQRMHGITPTDQSTTWPTAPPIALPSDQAIDLANHIVDSIPATPGIAEDLDQLMKDHPELWSFPDSISPTDIAAFSQSIANDAQQAYIDTLTQALAANPDNVDLQIELAKAQADQAQQEAEDAAETPETFNSISDNVFGQAYNPGEFDIPGRFTTFLTNIKSSGLFSFSSDFFNSLPGGGSSVYEIDGGETFGHHSIDLSDSLSGGLAVLKTILLAIFGFLSIRAVIMKR